MQVCTVYWYPKPRHAKPKCKRLSWSSLTSPPSSWISHTDYFLNEMKVKFCSDSEVTTPWSQRFSFPMKRGERKKQQEKASGSRQQLFTTLIRELGSGYDPASWLEEYLITFAYSDCLLLTDRCVVICCLLINLMILIDTGIIAW